MSKDNDSANEFNAKASALDLAMAENVVDITTANRGTGQEKQYEAGEYNREYAFIIVGGRGAILHEDPVAPLADRVRFLAVDAFKLDKANDTVWLKGESVSKAKFWMTDPNRRSYKGVVFEPAGEPPPGYYNMWRGYSFKPDTEPEPEKRCSIFLDHVRTNLADGNEEWFNFIMAWAADLLQRPAHRRGVAVVLRGGQGTGKTIFGKIIGRLIEDHYRLVDEPRYIVGNFNAHMASLLLLQADEGFWAGDKHAEGRLKGLVTSEEQMIELKGKDAFWVKNHVHLLVTSNNNWVVPAGHDERRFAVFDVAGNAQQNQEYFGEMVAQMENGGYEALLAYLLAFDLESVDLNHIPATAALLEQKLASLTIEEGWWYSCLDRGYVDSDGIGEWPSYILGTKAYSSYLKYCDQVKARHPLNDIKLGGQLRSMVPGLWKGKKPDSNGVRRQNYGFPKLEDCRAAFSEMLRTEVGWEDQE